MRRSLRAELPALAVILAAQGLLFSRPIHSGTNYDEDVYLAALDALRHGQALGSQVFAAQFPGFYDLLRGLSYLTGVGVAPVRWGATRGDAARHGRSVSRRASIRRPGRRLACCGVSRDRAAARPLRLPGDRGHAGAGAGGARAGARLAARNGRGTCRGCALRRRALDQADGADRRPSPALAARATRRPRVRRVRRRHRGHPRRTRRRARGLCGEAASPTTWTRARRPR